MAKNKALINYLARLVRKGVMQEHEIDANIREDVMAKVAELPPLTIDPVTKAPS